MARVVSYQCYTACTGTRSVSKVCSTTVGRTLVTRSVLAQQCSRSGHVMEVTWTRSGRRSVVLHDTRWLCVCHAVHWCAVLRMHVRTHAHRLRTGFHRDAYGTVRRETLVQHGHSVYMRMLTLQCHSTYWYSTISMVFVLTTVDTQALRVLYRYVQARKWWHVPAKGIFRCYCSYDSKDDRIYLCRRRSLVCIYDRQVVCTYQGWYVLLCS